MLKVCRPFVGFQKSTGLVAEGHFAWLSRATREVLSEHCLQLPGSCPEVADSTSLQLRYTRKSWSRSARSRRPNRMCERGLAHSATPQRFGHSPADWPRPMAALSMLSAASRLPPNLTLDASRLGQIGALCSMDSGDSKTHCPVTIMRYCSDPPRTSHGSTGLQLSWV